MFINYVRFVSLEMSPIMEEMLLDSGYDNCCTRIFKISISDEFHTFIST